jgi:hypothetical protein
VIIKKENKQNMMSVNLKVGKLKLMEIEGEGYTTPVKQK